MDSELEGGQAAQGLGCLAARASMRRFIGISLGGGRGKNTAVARIETRNGRYVIEEARIREGHRGGGRMDSSSDGRPFRDEVLVAYLEEWIDEETVVAIDTPLTLPPCLRCDLPCPGVNRCKVAAVKWMRTWAPSLIQRQGRNDPGKPQLTPYTQRPTELLLEHDLLQPRESLGQGMGPLAARSLWLRRRMSPRLRLNENFIEVHPRASIINLLGAVRERQSRHGTWEEVWSARKQILFSLSADLDFDRVWPELVVRNHHVFHAVVAALTASLWAKEGWHGPEDLFKYKKGEERAFLEGVVAAMGNRWLEEGWIWTPPVPAG